MGFGDEAGRGAEPEEQGTVLLADANVTTRPLVAQQLARHGYRDAPFEVVIIEIKD